MRLTRKSITQLKKVKSSIADFADWIYVKDGIAYKIGDEVSIGFYTDMPDCILPIIEFQKIVAKLKEPDFSFEDSVTTIKDGNREFTFQTNVEHFPEFEVSGEKVASVTTADLKGYQPFCKSNADIRKAFEYIAFESEGICATDAHTMKFDLEQTFDEPFYIKGSIAKMLLDDEYEVYQDDDNLYLKGDSQVIRQRKLDAKYPVWTGVLPSHIQGKGKPSGYIRDDYRDFKEKLELALVMTDNVTKRVVLHDGEIIAQDLDNDQSFTDKVSMTYEYAIGFNCKLLLDIVKKLNADEVEIAIEESGKAVIINGSYLLMPIRLHDWKKEKAA